VKIFRNDILDTVYTYGCQQIGVDIAGRLRIGLVLRVTAKRAPVFQFRISPNVHIQVWKIAATWRRKFIPNSPAQPPDRVG